MRGLTIIVADASPDRFRTAVTLAAASAALGARTTLFLEAPAVALLRRPIQDARDPDYSAAGLPTSAQAVEDALDLGVEMILCQSGLLLTGTTPADYDPRITQGGMVGLLHRLGDARLVVA